MSNRQLQASAEERDIFRAQREHDEKRVKSLTEQLDVAIEDRTRFETQRDVARDELKVQQRQAEMEHDIMREEFRARVHDLREAMSREDQLQTDLDAAKSIAAAEAQQHHQRNRALKEELRRVNAALGDSSAKAHHLEEALTAEKQELEFVKSRGGEYLYVSTL